MKNPIERDLFEHNGKMIELYKMEDNSYSAFAYENFDEENEIVAIGESIDRQVAIDLALENLHNEIRKDAQ